MNHCTSLWQNFLRQFVPAASCSLSQKPDKHSESRYNIVLAFCRTFRVHSSSLLRFHCSNELRVIQVDINHCARPWQVILSQRIQSVCSSLVVPESEGTFRSKVNQCNTLQQDNLRSSGQFSAERGVKCWNQCYVSQEPVFVILN